MPKKKQFDAYHTLSAIELWLDTVSAQLNQSVLNFPVWEELSLPGKTQEYLARFARERGELTNIIVTLYNQKRNIRKVSGAVEDNTSAEVPHIQKGQAGKAKRYLVDVQELLNIATERKYYIETAITTLRSIQSSMVHSDVPFRDPFDTMKRWGKDNFLEEGRPVKETSRVKAHIPVNYGKSKSLRKGELGDT